MTAPSLRDRLKGAVVAPPVVSIPAASIPQTAPDVSTSSELVVLNKDEVAHVLALKQGMSVFKRINLKRLVMNNGQWVYPTDEGYYIALNQEMLTHLEHHAKHDRVEKVTSV
jgi:hypothetical protein